MKRRAMQKSLLLPRLWLLIAPYEYIHVHMYIYSYMHTRKRPFIKKPTCFPFPWCEAPCTRSVTEEWAGRRAEDEQQDSCSKCDPDPAGYYAVRPPEGISWLCWGWRGQRTGGRPWFSPGTI